MGTEYTPGVGSYKVEESGKIKDIPTVDNVCSNMGTLTFNREAFSIAASGLPLALSSRFSSDHYYGTVIQQIAKGDQLSGTLMTMPGGNSNFYRFAKGWSWDLPYIIVGELNAFVVVINGTTIDLTSVISEEVFHSTDSEQWVEGFHVKYGSLSGDQKDLTVTIPEAQIIIKCTVERSGTEGQRDFEVLNTDAKPFKLYLADGTVLEFLRDDGTDYNLGFIKRIEDAAGKNSIRFEYLETLSHYTGTVTAVDTGDNARHTFTLTADSYGKASVGDLITVRDQTRVIWSKNGSNQITVSGGFDFLVTTSDKYYLGSNPISKISHYTEETFKRCVKFYYYTADSKQRMTLLLSGDPERDHIDAGDLFLNRYTFDANDNLEKYEILSTKDFTPTESFALEDATDEDTYFETMQSVSYAYATTTDPKPSTDYITITNHAGAFTKYYFQKGGFVPHSYGSVFYATGKVRKGSTKRLLILKSLMVC